jgi:ADP-heptose:LPS heptosyltransferase
MRIMTEAHGVIVHQGALGDFLLALPIIEGLHRASPQVRFDFWSRPAHLSLLHGKPYVASIFEAGSCEWMPFHDDNAWRDCPLPRGVADACRILLFGQRSSAVLAERLKTRVQAPVHWLKSFPGDDGKRHTTDFLEDQVRACQLPISMAPLRLRPNPRELAAMREWARQNGMAQDRRQVVVHPGSGGLRKVWPLSRWRALLERLGQRRDVQLFAALGPADERIRSFVQEVATPRRIPVVENLELPALAALISDSALYIGNDSGVTHLAASMGIPVVAIFGPTDPSVWGPRGEHVEIFRDSWDLEEILVSRPTSSDFGSIARLASRVEAWLDADTSVHSPGEEHEG